MAATVGAAGQRPVAAQVNARSNLRRVARGAPVRCCAWTRQRILVVEDDEAIASGLVRVLDSQGYDVRAAGARRAPRSAAAAERRRTS